MKELGFKMWFAHSNFGDSYLDEKRYWPLLAKAQELDMPIYLHPTAPMIPELRSFGYCLAGPTFGFGVEVAWVFLRMIHRGVFDEFPGLKVILGHFGEALPFLLDRVDTGYRQGYSRPRPEIGPGSKHAPSYYVAAQSLGDIERQLPAGSVRVRARRARGRQSLFRQRLPVRTATGGRRLHEASCRSPTTRGRRSSRRTRRCC